APIKVNDIITKGCLDPMRRNIPYLRAGELMMSGRSHARGLAKIHSRALTPNRVSDHRVLSVDRWKPNLEDSVDSVLSSALVAQDKELARILQEVDQLSKTLKSEAPNTQTLCNTLKRTVLCAVKQSLLDRELRSLAL